MDTYSMGYSGSTYADMPINHKVFLAQFDAIKKIADEGPCILIGRCADYALESYENVITVFINADMDIRIRRIARKYDLTDAKAKDMIAKTDKKRSSYYNYYTNKKWSDAESYELCLNSGELGVEGTAKAIEQYVALKESIKAEDKKL
jgi:cytidylate kinase